MIMTQSKYRKRDYNLHKSIHLILLGDELRDMLIEGVISKKEFAAAYDMGKALRELVTGWNDNYYNANKS